MSVYTFWNNKGGTGKTSLAFQTICMYALEHSEEKILAIDLCPQANLSELFLGGLLGNGSQNLMSLQNQNPRKSIGGYFQARLPSPYSMPSGLAPESFLCKPESFNPNVPQNIDLVAGDSVLELQSNAIATLAIAQIPGVESWVAIIDWVKDFIEVLKEKYDHIFIDANPSFSIYTQIALSCSDRLILPVMADDSSRRGVQNAFALVHGINLPSPTYLQYSFSQRLRQVSRNLPLIHIIAKNRLTQYMGPASAYHSVLTTIDSFVSELISSHPHIFTFSSLSSGVAEIRDFQTTGVVAFAKGLPFPRLRSGLHSIENRRIQINSGNIEYCINAMNSLVSKI